MENAFAQPQTLVCLGGSSDIARAITRQLTKQRLRTVVLAGRSQELLDEAAKEATANGATTTATVVFDANDLSDAERVVKEAFDLVEGSVDLVVVAVGLLGHQREDENSADAAGRMAVVNFAWPVAALAEIQRRLVQQGHGRILVISSVAAIRVRRSMYLYAGAKAGLDRLCEGLADSLIGTGVSMHILRPGFVKSKMTEGLPTPPFTTGVDEVATTALKGLARSQRVITSPPILAWVFLVLRHLPNVLWRKVDDLS